MLTLDLGHFHQRVAEHVLDGASCVEAEHRALTEIDMPTIDDLYAAVIKQWRDSLPTTADDDGAILLAHTKGFLGSPWALQALELGWDSLGLFSVFSGEWDGVRQRYDTWGLIPSRAFSRFPLKLAELERDGAMLVNTETGSHLWHPRWPHGADFMVAWWEHPILQP